VDNSFFAVSVLTNGKYFDLLNLNPCYLFPSIVEVVASAMIIMTT